MLPRGLTEIQVAFQKDEKLVHSIKFVGESVLEIGAVDTDETDKDRRKARVESFVIKSDESLVGCEIYLNSNDKCVYGFRWMKWCRPSADLKIDPEPSLLALPSSEEFCNCAGSEANDGKCLACSKQKKVVEKGVTCDKGDELEHRIASADETKQNCSECCLRIMPLDEYYACKRANTDCQYRSCRNCFKGELLMFVPGFHCNRGYPLLF